MLILGVFIYHIVVLAFMLLVTALKFMSLYSNLTKKVVGGQLIEPGSHRTNNHVDSWHRKFSTKACSEVFELVEMFKRDQADTLTSPHSHLHGCL